MLRILFPRANMRPRLRPLLPFPAGAGDEMLPIDGEGAGGDSEIAWRGSCGRRSRIGDRFLLIGQTLAKSPWQISVEGPLATKGSTGSGILLPVPDATQRPQGAGCDGNRASRGQIYLLFKSRGLSPLLIPQFHRLAGVLPVRLCVCLLPPPPPLTIGTLLLLSRSIREMGNSPSALQQCIEAVGNGRAGFAGFPSSPFYQASWVQPYNLDISITPAAVVRPQTPEDVAGVVKCAAANNVKVQAKSGGHSYGFVLWGPPTTF